MTDYISRQAALNESYPVYIDGESYDVVQVETLFGLPSAPVREVKRGRWNDKMLDNFRKYEVVCSLCGARYIGNYDAYDEPYDFNFCPNCGADMREEA